MTTKDSRKRTARTVGAVQAGSENGGALFSTNIIPDSSGDYKHGLSAVYRYILSVEWGRQ